MAIINHEIGINVYIDIDIVFADFLRSILMQRIKAKLSDVEKFTGAKIIRFAVRPSSSGNAHLCLSFDREIQILENLCIRAWLHDDIYRLNLDLVRLLKTNDKNMVNRLWSGKYKKVDFACEMKLAGIWTEIDLTAITGSAGAPYQASQHAAQPTEPQQKRLTDDEIWAQWDEAPDQSLPFTLPEPQKDTGSDHPHCIPEQTDAQKPLIL